MTAEVTATRLVNMKEFARRLGGVSVRTVERLYSADVPELPSIVRLANVKLFDEAEVDRFLASLVKRGGVPGQAAFTPRGAAGEAVRQKAAKSRAATKPTRRERQHA